MRVGSLTPLPEVCTRFAWSHHVTVPDKPGCYAICTYGGDVLYVGLATTSIRSRMGAHLDVTEKRRGAEVGVPFWFFYIERPAQDVAPIERGWMNQAILEDGAKPPLNKVYSPL
jgi:hypothetical protein